MAEVKNILFIMCDQLRYDYLSCMGHARLETPHIDALAARGMLFKNSFCQAPVCGGSRMCFYTGRYAFTHGGTWNLVPLPVGEMTMGDHLRPLGHRVALVGKTHMVADRDAMRRLAISPRTVEGLLYSECGFEPYERDDGLWGRGDDDAQEVAYNAWLKGHGYEGINPWHDYANSAAGPDGEILSGWHMRNAKYPARIQEEHSETAYMTQRAMAFVDDCGDDPWTLHLSYIKPHWPYMAPSPYHAMYGAEDVQPANRAPHERDTDHPVYQRYFSREDAVSFADENVRRTVIPAYMGLVKQIDDHLGKLFAFLEERGRMDDTMIVFTSDHGDYLGDHWLAEKELFHEESVRIPLIVYDPDPAADATRGKVEERLVESIDLLPTFMEAAGGTAPAHILEGRSLLPLMRGADTAAVPWREHAVSESEYAQGLDLDSLGITAREARGVMVRTHRWKYIHHLSFRPELYDLETDPGELTDLGADPGHETVRAEMRDRMVDHMLRRNFRSTVSDEIMARRSRLYYDRSPKRHVYVGQW